MKNLGIKTIGAMFFSVLLCASAHGAGVDGRESIKPGKEVVDVTDGPQLLEPVEIQAEAIDQRRDQRHRMRRREFLAGPEERQRMRDQRRQWQREMREGLGEEDRRRLRGRLEERERLGKSVPGPRAGRKLREDFRGATDQERADLRQRLRDTPPAERERLRRNLRSYRALDAQEQESLRRNLDEIRGLPEDARERLDENRERWSALSREERDALRSRMRRLREMPPERRIELLDRALEGPRPEPKAP